MDRSNLIRLKGILRGRPCLGPKQVNIHVTNICDRRCLFCWYFSPFVSRRERGRHLDFEVLKRLIRDCQKTGVETMNFEGGEVTLYPRIREAFKLVRASGMKVITYSHLAFEPDRLDYLKLADAVSVNLSAATRASYLKIHGHDRFGLVEKNVKFLRSLKTSGGRTRIILSFVIIEDNFREIGRFLSLAQSWKVDEVRFKLHIATEEMKDLVLCERSFRSLKKEIFRLTKNPYPFKHNLKDVLRLLTTRSFMKNRMSLSWSRRHNDRYLYYDAYEGREAHCFVGWFYSLIDERGRVIAPCDNVGVCLAGNITRESFARIWYDSPAFKRIREISMTQIDTRHRRWRECRCCGYVAFNEKILSYLRGLSPGFCSRKGA